MLESTGALREDNEGIVNYLLEIEGVEIALSRGGARQRGTKFSLRCQGRAGRGRSRWPCRWAAADMRSAAGCTLADAALDSALEDRC